MEIAFNEVAEKVFEAEFEAIGDFNLHLEREDTGSFVVSQRGSASGEYVTSFVSSTYEGRQRVIDYDFGALVYPKWIKVTSSSKVVKGEVTFA